MVDYAELRKELYEKFHDAYHKLYVSELKDQIAEKDEVITACNHLIAEQQAQIEALEYRIKYLEKVAADASWTTEMYRDQIDDRPKW